MTVHLTPELERLVQRQIDTGLYQSPAEVLGEALRLMQERGEVLTLRAEIRRQIAQGYESLRNGDSVDGDEFFAQLEREENARVDKQHSA
ncbi:MAG: type II toxin-antitoxin system ParD family antitoxin [Bryobacterales bacterium]|nr:type II toxin-antitoxin system ParD family antitoxin [Bryobacterales bacterium]